MKHILIVSMSAQLGGIEKSLVNFLRYLDKVDCSVDLLLWKKQGELLDSIPNSVSFVEAPTPGNLRSIMRAKSCRRLWGYLKLKFYTSLKKPWKSLPNLRKKYDVAISYTQDGYSPFYVIDNVKAERKYLWFHHGAYIGNEKDKHRDEVYYSGFDKIITVSKANKEMLTREFPRLGKNIEVIQNLLDDSEINRLARKECTQFDGVAQCKITTVGRLSREKGQLDCLDVAAKLREKGFGFRWCFVGDGPDYEICLQKVKDYHLEEYCQFIGAQSNPYPFILNADIYVQLSLVEADPVTIQEALILKKRIVASDIPPIREALQDGKLGTLVDIVDAADMIINEYGKVGKDREFNTGNFSRNKCVEAKLNQILFEGKEISRNVNKVT